MNYDSISKHLRTGTPPAPGGLILIEGLLNTSSEELQFDDFETTDSTEAWLRNLGLWLGEKSITQEQHHKIISFRNDLRRWILSGDNLSSLNDVFSEVSFSAELGTDGKVKFISKNTNYQKVIGSFIQVIYESQENGTWNRFKCCALPSCGWAFFDSSRSRTKRWCSMKTCGSRHKAREHYKRKRRLA